MSWPSVMHWPQINERKRGFDIKERKKDVGSAALYMFDEKLISEYDLTGSRGEHCCSPIRIHICNLHMTWRH